MPPGRAAARRAPAVPVGVAAAAKGDIPVVLRALGTVTPLATVNVKTQITGQLIEVHFKEGQLVKQGDLLAVVDPRPYDVALQQAIGTMQRDEALLKNAQTDLERYRKLVAQDSLARQQLDTQQALVRQYEAALVINQALVDAAKLNVTYTKIIAPLTGRIGLRMVDKGNYVTMGDADGHLRHHPDPADFGDLHHSRGCPAAGAPAPARPAHRSRCAPSTARRRSNWASASSTPPTT